MQTERSGNLQGIRLFSLSAGTGNNSILSVDQIMNQSQKTNNTRFASRKELRVTWLLAPLMSNRERKHSKRQKLSCFWVEVNIECGIGGGDDC